MTTEQQLISAKAAWAGSEHEREMAYSQAQTLEEKVNELEEQNMALQKQVDEANGDFRGRR